MSHSRLAEQREDRIVLAHPEEVWKDLPCHVYLLHIGGATRPARQDQGDGRDQH